MWTKFFSLNKEPHLLCLHEVLYSQTRYIRSANSGIIGKLIFSYTLNIYIYPCWLFTISHIVTRIVGPHKLLTRWKISYHKRGYASLDKVNINQPLRKFNQKRSATEYRDIKSADSKFRFNYLPNDADWTEINLVETIVNL